MGNQMDPFTVHLERSPQCSFVCSVQSKNNHEENLAKRQKTDSTTDASQQQHKLNELNILTQVRRRTFSHWPHQTSPTTEQMIKAGFFHCNVGDRVICLYCNLICQQWKGDIDDPSDVHKTLSPKCAYVLFMLADENASPISTVNEVSTSHGSDDALLLNNANRLRFDQIVYTSPCHAAYTSIPNRQTSFETWTNVSTPSVDDLVKAGFFYTGTKSIVTCFYCNGSLQNWGERDNPMIEHIRWFPHCAYAKQLGGIDLYNKVQQAKRTQQGRNKPEESMNATSIISLSASNNNRLQISDEALLSRLVAARIDLPISQRLLNQNIKLSIIKRCWEDQLRLKRDDFVSDCDLFIACTILQKQIEHINGKKENIIVPSIKMKSIPDTLVAEQLSSSSSLPASVLTDVSAHASSSVESMTVETTNQQMTKTEETKSEAKLSVNNPCVLCGIEEKRLACIPCGHLTTCTNCSQTLRTCPICRREIEAYVRIYI